MHSTLKTFIIVCYLAISFTSVPVIRHLSNISKITNFLSQKEDADQDDNLVYFHRYEATRGVPNKEVPLQQHYINERALRKKSYKLKDELSDYDREASMQTRELKHKANFERNKALRFISLLNAQKRLYLQKEAALKDEMNHEEKAREFYENRLKINDKSERTALPDQRAEFQKLARFDRDEVKHYGE